MGAIDRLEPGRTDGSCRSASASAQTYTYGQPAYAAPQPTSAWDTYKVRLAALARQQGVHESTIQANVPGLQVNQRIIDLERTEPIARTSGGVVGALAPYLRAHVTSTLIRRGAEQLFEPVRRASLDRGEMGCRPDRPARDLRP